MGQFATRCGTIESVERGRARVRMEPAPPEGGKCASCGSSHGCGGGAPRTTRMKVGAPPGAAPGDRVFVRMWVPSPGWSVLAIFLIPLLCLGLGAGAWAALASAGAVPESDALALLAGVGLMALWYIGLAVHERCGAKARDHAPKIVPPPPSE